MGVKLTKAAVDRLAAPDPSGRQTIAWDTELRGFGVLVSGTTNKKTYIAQRRMPDGRTRRVTVGDVAEFQEVRDARLRAGRQLAELREGRDPKTERRRTKAQDRTLSEWLDAYLKSRKSLRERSAEEYRRCVGQHLAGWVDRPLRLVTADVVEDLHAAIGEGAGPAAANSTMRALRAVWNYAMDRDSTLPPNPTRRLKSSWFPMPPRTRVVRSGEMVKFYQAVDQLENRAASDYLKLLLLTGLRRREAAALRWDEVDLTERVIRLPAERTKADRRLDLPMSAPVRSLLVARRAIGDDGPWVFGANSRSGHIEEPKSFLAQVAGATGITVSVHDLRRTFITVAEGADISGYALKALVNHALGRDVTSGYIQMTVDALRTPAERVGARIAELCGITPPDGENVAVLGQQR